MNVTELIVRNLEDIRHDIKDIKSKLHELFEFKWKVIGMACLFSFVTSLAGSFIYKKLIINEGKAGSIDKGLGCENDEVHH